MFSSEKKKTQTEKEIQSQWKNDLFIGKISFLMASMG